MKRPCACIVSFLFLVLNFDTIRAQTTLTFDIFEDEQVPYTIGDMLLLSGLRDRYTPEQVSEMSLVIGDHESDLDRFFDVSTTGLLIVATQLDRDVICANQMTCTIDLDLRVQPPQYFEIIKVQLTVVDKNDNTPTFEVGSSFALEIAEGPLSNLPHPLPLATDPDSPTFGISRYELRNADASQFQLDSTDNLEPKLLIKIALDRETTAQYGITLLAIDGGTPAKTGSLAVAIEVQDTNDQYPVFENAPYEATVDEDITVGSPILVVFASDADVGENKRVSYFLAPQSPEYISNSFDVNQVNGKSLAAVHFSATSCFI